jgi:hypothetical protein
LNNALLPTLANILLCAVVSGLLWTLLGWAILLRIAPGRPLTLAMAPVLGWAVYAASSFPILLLLGFSRGTVAALTGIVLLASLFAIARTARRRPDAFGSLPAWAFVVAAIVALAPAIAIMPKAVADGVILSEQMFDHSKVAMVDEFVRLGLPAGNPFFGEAGEPSRLSYYYLWHFATASSALVLGVNGWEADIAETWFTAFASLALMMGLAVDLGRRNGAALWVGLLGLGISAEPTLVALLGARFYGGFSPDPVLQSWIVQASWVPQHLASADCIVVAVFLLSRITRGRNLLTLVVLALAVAAGFESSAWIGGATLTAAAVPLAVTVLWSAEPGRRLAVMIELVLAAGLAVAVALPILHDEALGTVARGVGVPIALRPVQVLGDLVPATIRRFLDLPAYWLLFLAIKLPAIYPAGAVALWQTIAATDASGERKSLAAAFAALTVSCFVVGWLLVSTIANNDLGWRAVLPGVMVLTVFAAAGLARWIATSRRLAAGAALLLLVISLPDGFAFIRGNIVGRPTASARAFAATPALWEAVRRYAGPGDRVGNDPKFLANMTTWPVNISWALLADRPSCFGGRETARAYVSLPGAEIERLEALFSRVFAGQGTPDEVRAMATRYDCRVVVVTPEDGAWASDPFAHSGLYHLAEEKAGAWRIYVIDGRDAP